MSGQLQPGPTLMPGEPRYESLAKEFASEEFAIYLKGQTPKGFRFRFIHPIANLLPMIPAHQRSTFRASLESQGQNHAVIFHQGLLLDGRNRARELIELQKPISTAVFVGDIPQALEFVKAENIERRHLNESQRADFAARVAQMPVGANQHSKPAPIGAPSLPLGDTAENETAPQPMISQNDAADMFNVSRRSVQRAATVLEKGVPELQGAVQAGDIAVSVAEKIARLPEAEQPAALEKALPNGNRAIMSSRQEPDASLDFFPTPPWATRALVEKVFPRFAIDIPRLALWEPACGEGHMAEVLREYCADVLATDIFDYGYGERPLDFLSDLEAARLDQGSDLIITNPPFGDKGEAFVLQALKHARVGVAMFVRLQWLETIGRYENIFKDNPPTLIAFFAERVNLCKGRWDPEGGTATAYIWLVWIKGEQSRAPFWIPPGCRESLTKPDDAVRFTQRPVAKAVEPVETSEAAE